MYLFEDVHVGRIAVYDFTIRQDEARAFRISEMARIRKDKVPVYMVREFLEKEHYPIFSIGKYRHEVWKKDLANVNFIPYSKNYRLDVLERFYNGELTNDPRKPKKLIIVHGASGSESDGRHDDYYLVEHPSLMSRTTTDVIIEAHNVIKIPKSLYLLSAIEQGRFRLTRDEDIKRQIKLFDIEKVEEFNAYDRLTENSCFVGRVKELKNYNDN